jgi:putative transposase
MSAVMIDSERYFTAATLAGLPALPQTARGVLIMAQREQWAARQRAHGKGWEFALASLPADAQRELRRRDAISAATAAATRTGQTEGRRVALAEHVDQAVAWRAQQSGAAKLAGLTGAARARADARMDALVALETYARTANLSISAALDPFCGAYARGEIAMPEQTRVVLGATISAPTLRRWRDTLRQDGAAALAGDYGNRSGCGVLDSDAELHALATAMLIEHPHASARAVMRALSARNRDRALPTLRTLQRFISRWRDENAQVLLAIANPDAWKNKHMLAFGSASEDIVRLNQRWEFDSTPADLQLEDGRYSLVGIIDVWSRRAILQVAKTSSSAAVCCAVRRAVLAWGVPEQAKVDNGQDYTSHHVTRALRNLGAEPLVSAPFSPWEKPHIERFFRTFSHDLVELLPGYAGHNVADAQAIRARHSFADRLFRKGETIALKLSSAQLQDVCDRWCRDIYEQDERAGLGGMTVFERVASWRHEVRRVNDARALDILLAEAPDGHGGRTVTKKGLRVDGFTYMAPDLGALVGERVRVLYDPADMGRIVVYRDESFVCVAECPEILGLSRRELAVEAKTRQKQEISEMRRELKAAARKQRTTDIAREILDARQDQAAALAAMPPKNVVLLTPAIEAAREAAEALDASPQQSTLPPLTVADVREVHDRIRADQVQDESSEARFARCLDVLLQAPEGRNDIDRQWLKRQMETPEFRARWLCLEDFGPAGMGLDQKYEQLLPAGAFYHRYVKATKGEI